MNLTLKQFYNTFKTILQMKMKKNFSLTLLFLRKKK